MFDRLHRNKKWAFIDGFLTGTVTTAFVAYLLNEKREQSHRDQLRATETKWHEAGYTGGWNSALQCAHDLPQDSPWYPRPVTK